MVTNERKASEKMEEVSGKMRTIVGDGIRLSLRRSGRSVAFLSPLPCARYWGERPPRMFEDMQYPILLPGIGFRLEFSFLPEPLYPHRAHGEE